MSEYDLSTSDNETAGLSASFALKPPAIQDLPSWSEVYKNYPKNSAGGDLPSSLVYPMVFGEKYNPLTKKLEFSNQVDASNSCALRVSIALVRSGITLPSDYLGKEGEFKGKGVILSSVRLIKHLKNSVFGPPTEELDLLVMSVADARKKLQGRKGIYCMKPKSGAFSTAVGHASLWEGSEAMGNHSYIEHAKVVYFWELK